jgi:hypothetical protein
MTSLVISAAEADQIIDWNAEKLTFYTKKTAKGRKKVAYSTYISDKIHEDHQVDVVIKDGFNFGAKDVVIYLHCKQHMQKFNASISRRDFKPKKNLVFQIRRCKRTACNCSKTDFRVLNTLSIS